MDNPYQNFKVRRKSNGREYEVLEVKKEDKAEFYLIDRGAIVGQVYEHSNQFEKIPYNKKED